MSKFIVNASDSLVSLETENGHMIHVRTSRIAWVDESPSGFRVKLHGRWRTYSVTRKSGFKALDALTALCELPA